MLHRDIECRLTLRILDGRVCASAHQDFDNGLVAETGSVMQGGVAGAIRALRVPRRRRPATIRACRVRGTTNP